MISIIKMSEADFKIFEKYCARKEEEGCKHPVVIDGPCDDCYQILYYKRVDECDSRSRASHSYVSKHSRVKHFEKVLDKKEVVEVGQLISDFEDFSWGWDVIDKGGRKNFLLNGWVLWKLSERRGIECEKYEIKNVKSEKEHERLCVLVFEKLGW